MIILKNEGLRPHGLCGISNQHGGSENPAALRAVFRSADDELRCSLNLVACTGQQPTNPVSGDHYEFKGGYPTKESAAALNDELRLQRVGTACRQSDGHEGRLGESLGVQL